MKSAVAGITSVAAGSDFSAWLNGGTGALYTAGHPQFGVLGHGTDNEYNARDSSVKLVYAPQPQPRIVQALATVKVRAVACGTQHMLGKENFEKSFFYPGFSPRSALFFGFLSSGSDFASVCELIDTKKLNKQRGNRP